MERGSLVSFVDRTLTPRMRAALQDEQHTLRVGAGCFPFLMAALGLIYAVVARQAPGASLRFRLPLWFIGERRHRAALAVGSYRRYSGQLRFGRSFAAIGRSGGSSWPG